MTRVPRHGTFNEYKLYKCRCELCRAAKAKAHLNDRGICPRCGGPAWNKSSGAGVCRACYQELRPKMELGKRETIRHGTEYAYLHFCRCEECTAAAARNRKARRARQKARSMPTYTFAEALSSASNGGATELPAVPSFESRGEGRSLLEVVNSLTERS